MAIKRFDLFKHFLNWIIKKLVEYFADYLIIGIFFNVFSCFLTFV